MTDETTNNAPVEESAATSVKGKKVVKKSDTIEVKTDILQEILDQNKQFKEIVEKQNEKIEILEESVNQNKLSEAQGRRKDPEKPRSFLKVFRGKIVVSWKSSRENKIVYQGSNPVGEVLQATYYYSDGSDSGLVDQVEFIREESRVWGRWEEDLGDKVKLKLEELETPDRELEKTFQIPTEEIIVDKLFINP